MKKTLILLLLSVLPAFASEELQDVGISKYAVLEVLKDNTPLREKADEFATRVTHLFKDAVLFADKQNDKYYRVELKDGKYVWVNKKHVEVQAVIPEKRFDNIEKVSFKEEHDRYIAKINTPSKSAFIFKEDGNNLDFTLFDNRFDPTEAEVKNKENNFKFANLISNEFNLEYQGYTPLFGYIADRGEKGYVLTIKKSPKINKKRPLKHIKIVLDPGHGGDEKGAVAFNMEEKTINLQISKKLKSELKRRGAKVYMTRTKDKKVGLYDRTAFARQKDADILLSIHQNSLPNPKDVYKKHGVGTYYYNKQAEPLARNIKDSLKEATGFMDDGVNYASFALTRPTLPVSVLVECGYIIDSYEANYISNEKNQKIIAKAIAKGVENYLTETFGNN